MWLEWVYSIVKLSKLKRGQIQLRNNRKLTLLRTGKGTAWSNKTKPLKCMLKKVMTQWWRKFEESGVTEEIQTKAHGCRYNNAKSFAPGFSQVALASLQYPFIITVYLDLTILFYCMLNTNYLCCNQTEKWSWGPFIHWTTHCSLWIIHSHVYLPWSL